mmetsp:Transcript_35012/g.88667  ORF Transcript_35012/g.88667 Transcript_35012/m.88667 type:complete len:101 (-) Transcript_35012:142-444(-)
MARSLHALQVVMSWPSPAEEHAMLRHVLELAAQHVLTCVSALYKRSVHGTSMQASAHWAACSKERALHVAHAPVGKMASHTRTRHNRRPAGFISIVSGHF